MVTLACPDVPGRGPSLVVHTSVSFGLENLEKDKEEVQAIIVGELAQLLPALPQPVSLKCQKWRYSQVSPDQVTLQKLCSLQVSSNGHCCCPLQVLTSVPDCPGHMTILDRPLLVCGGDAFTHSNFDGCVESAESVVAALKVALKVAAKASPAAPPPPGTRPLK